MAAIGCWIICQKQMKLVICATMAHMMIAAFDLRPKKFAYCQKAVKEADWIMHLDIDEFLNIHVR